MESFYQNVYKMVLAVSALSICCMLPHTGQADPGFSFGNAASGNQACLDCHSDMQTVGDKNLISAAVFSHTTHAMFGCKTCHDTVSSDHPKDGTVARTTTCTNCHGDIAAEYATNKHSHAVPNCNACHNPHKVLKPNEISALAMTATCMNCHNHNTIKATHAQWLPQTDLHLGSITCVTCHTRTKNFVVSVYVARRDVKAEGSSPVIADYHYLSTKLNSRDVQFLVDRNRDNSISIEELKLFNGNPENKDLYLKAILTPTKTSHAFQTSDKSWNCTFCHANGPSEAQITRLVLPQPDGTFAGFDVEKGTSLSSLNAIPNFYMMGSSRNKLVNNIGVLFLTGGLIMPVGHGFIRFMTRRNRRKE
ncbi:MAG: cytochrome c3 family protein [Desulfuromonadaceae bacterium]|nr:cytochrome c3 family protein [Desulfuromonadaceae bacterium]MDD4131052.1 cytochrome c3 family protein [Desulfuromonadaceae bacterium]